ncbi:hypothetical protein [Spongorhabdus nitratireducens]
MSQKRKLKEAKRQKRKTKQAVSQAPEVKLQKRVTKKFGVKARTNASALGKLSEALTQFAAPLVRMTENLDEQKGALQFSVLCWNLGLLDDEKKNSLLQTLKEKGTVSDDHIEGADSDLSMMIDRKREKFGHDRRYIMDYEIQMQGGKLALNVAGVNMDDAKQTEDATVNEQEAVTEAE